MEQNLSIIESKQSEESYLDLMNKILDNLIVNYPNPEFERENEEIILKFYDQKLRNPSLSRPHGIPDFFSLSESITEYNEGSFWEAALIEFDNEYNMNDYPDDESKLEEIEMISSGLQEIYQNDTINMDDYLEFLLRKYRLSYTFEEGDVYYNDKDLVSVSFLEKHFEGRSILFVANDCQNLLFPRMLKNGCGGYCDFINYYNFDFEINLNETLMLEGGR